MTSSGVVIPVYNEVERLRDYVFRLVEWAERTGTSLLFVDDGSTDATCDLLESLLADAPGELLRRPHAGKGAAVAAGVRAMSADVVAFCDLDLSTPLEDLEVLIRLAGRAHVLAIGSRDVVGSVLAAPEGKVRETLGRTYNRLLQLLVTPGVVDTQCGAKAARREVWSQVLEHCEERGFAWDAEVVSAALALAIPVREVPVTWEHDDRTRVRLAADGAEMLLASLRIARRTARLRRRVARPPSERARSPMQHHDQDLLRADPRHWWFRSRAALVSTALRRCGAATDGRLVDIGAGPGALAALLGWHPDRIVTVDPDPQTAHAPGGLGLFALRAAGDAVPLGTATSTVVLLLDVLEHTDDPGSVLAEALRLLRPGGHLVVMVPAHRFLWSSTDEVLGHRRRYRSAEVRALLDGAGFTVVLETHVLVWALPAVLVIRKLLGRVDTGIGTVPTAVDRVALACTSLERHLLGRVRAPFGTSILHVGTPRPAAGPEQPPRQGP